MQTTNSCPNVTTVVAEIDSIKFDVSYMTAIEMLHILGMTKWQSTAPQVGKYGWRNGERLQNSQQARLQYLLESVGFQDPEGIYSTLAIRNRYERVSESKITKSKPHQGLPLPGGWHIDSCQNINQKLEVVETLTNLGYSRDFITFAKKFVNGVKAHSTCQVIPATAQHSR